MSEETRHGCDGGFFTFDILGIAFVILKLTSCIGWSWWWVLLPFWAGRLLMAFLMACAKPTKRSGHRPSRLSEERHVGEVCAMIDRMPADHYFDAPDMLNLREIALRTVIDPPFVAPDSYKTTKVRAHPGGITYHQDGVASRVVPLYSVDDRALMLAAAALIGKTTKRPKEG